MNKKYLIYLLVVVLIISLAINVRMYSDSQSLKREIKNNRVVNTYTILEETMIIYTYTNQWQNKKEENKNDKDYIYILGIISNRLDISKNLLPYGHHEWQDVVELYNFLGAYSNKAAEYASPFYSEQVTDEDFARAESLINDLHLISKWLFENRERNSLFTIQELKNDGLYEKLQTEDVKFLIGDN